MGNMLFMTQGVENTDPEPMAMARQKSVLKKTTTFEYAGTLPKLQNVTELGADRPVTYDAAGNETHYLVDRTYSPRNLFASIRQADEAGGGSHRLDFSYDGRGLRVARKESPANGPLTSATRRYFYTPDLRLLAATYDDSASVWEPVLGSSAVTKNFRDEFVWFADRPIAQIAPATGASVVLYTFADHLGTPLLQTDATGQIVWRVEYEPFGNVHEVRAGVRNSQPLRFPGQDTVMAWDGGTEENYNVFRWYRSGWGRYTQADPVGRRGDPNPYAYALGDPVSNADPWGLATLMCREVGTVVKGTYVQIPGSRHCRVRVWCEDCPKIDVTVGLENVGPGKFDINELPFPSGVKEYDDNRPINLGGASECQFAKCVRANNKVFDQGYTGGATNWMPKYNMWGPNSNTYAEKLISTCGGSADFPPGAIGAN
jgi:RHS repeat-associated protein